MQAKEAEPSKRGSGVQVVSSGPPASSSALVSVTRHCKCLDSRLCARQALVVEVSVRQVILESQNRLIREGS